MYNSTSEINLLTCDATVRLRATPPAFKLIKKILQSGSSLNLFIAASLAAIVILPTNWTHCMPDCTHSLVTMVITYRLYLIHYTELSGFHCTFCRE